jgi:hypothetical protein
LSQLVSRQVGLSTVPVSRSSCQTTRIGHHGTLTEPCILHNGQSPDPVRAITPGADLVYDGTGTGTCFADNVFDTEFPAGITEQFPCGN